MKHILRSTFAYLALLGTLLLSACGGGGVTASSSGSSGGTPGYTLSVSVTGLAGTVVITDNYDSLTLTANGTYSFPTKFASGALYMISVTAHPIGQTCNVVTNGSGAMSGNITASVSCVASGGTGTTYYPIGGSITGLTGSVTLLDNSGNPYTTSANGTFAFTTQLLSGMTYNVTVGAQPIGQYCSVANGAGTVTGAVTNVAVTCIPMTYTIGGTITGLSGSTVLQDNGGDNLTVSANGTFQFATAIPASTAYKVTQLSQTSTSQTCTVTNGSGTATANITTVTVTCVPVTVVPNPSIIAAGNPAFTLTALGTGYLPNSVVNWNGVAMPSSYVSATEVLAQVPASAVAAAGTAQVVVVNPGPLPASSPAATVNIVAPSKDATNLQIDARHSGVINFNGVALPTAAKWSYTFTSPPSYALTGAGNVYVTTYNSTANTTTLYALAQSTGLASVWAAPIQIPSRANAVYDNGQVIVLSGYIGTTGTVTAYNAATGAVNWTTTLPSSWYTDAPTVADGFVYVNSSSGVSAINEATGALVWTKGSAGTNGSLAVTADGVYLASPCTAQDYRPATGEIAWVYSGGCSGGGGATSVLNNNSFLLAPINVASYSGPAFNAETGASLGSFTADSMPALDSTVGYFLQGGVLNALNLSNMSLKWATGFSGDLKLVSSPIVVNSGTSSYIFIGSSAGNLYGLNAAGTQVWHMLLANPIAAGAGGNGSMPYSNMSAGAGYLFVPNGNVLTAYQLSTAP